jgi:predicted transcriptional regulator
MMFYIKINYVTIFADFEKIPVKLGSNKKVCYLLRILEQNCEKLSFKQKLAFGTKFRIKQMKNFREDLKKEIKNIENEIKEEGKS